MVESCKWERISFVRYRRWKHRDGKRARAWRERAGEILRERDAWEMGVLLRRYELAQLREASDV